MNKKQHSIKGRLEGPDRDNLLLSAYLNHTTPHEVVVSALVEAALLDGEHEEVSWEDQIGFARTFYEPITTGKAHFNVLLTEEMVFRLTGCPPEDPQVEVKVSELVAHHLKGNREETIQELVDRYKCTEEEVLRALKRGGPLLVKELVNIFPEGAILHQQEIRTVSFRDLQRDSSLTEAEKHEEWVKYLKHKAGQLKGLAYYILRSPEEIEVPLCEGRNYLFNDGKRLGYLLVTVNKRGKAKVTDSGGKDDIRLINKKTVSVRISEKRIENWELEKCTPTREWEKTKPREPSGVPIYSNPSGHRWPTVMGPWSRTHLAKKEPS